MFVSEGNIQVLIENFWSRARQNTNGLDLQLPSQKAVRQLSTAECIFHGITISRDCSSGTQCFRVNDKVLIETESWFVWVGSSELQYPEAGCGSSKWLPGTETDDIVSNENYKFEMLLRRPVAFFFFSENRSPENSSAEQGACKSLFCLCSWNKRSHFVHQQSQFAGALLPSQSKEFSGGGDKKYCSTLF